MSHLTAPATGNLPLQKSGSPLQRVDANSEHLCNPNAHHVQRAHYSSLMNKLGISRAAMAYFKLTNLSHQLSDLVRDCHTSFELPDTFCLKTLGFPVIHLLSRSLRYISSTGFTRPKGGNLRQKAARTSRTVAFVRR
jgi:hypothetical protein